MKFRWIAIAVLGGLLGWATAQPGEPDVVGVQLAAFVVSEEAREDGTVVEVFREAEEVFPGQVVEYRLVAANRSDALLPAGLALIGPVPSQTRYLPASATAGGPEWRLEASLDGETFAEPPLWVVEVDAEGRETEVEADPGDYRALRWVLLRAMQPREEIEVRYRVVVR